LRINPFCSFNYAVSQTLQQADAVMGQTCGYQLSEPVSIPDLSLINPCSGGKNSLFLSTGNSTANALSYGVSSQPPETQRARIFSNSLFFPAGQGNRIWRRVRAGLPAQPTSHVLSAVSRLLSDTPEERTQFPLVIATAHPTAPKPRSLAGGFRSPIAPESPKAKNGLAVWAADPRRRTGTGAGKRELPRPLSA
jgi:hypothetical protein